MVVLPVSRNSRSLIRVPSVNSKISSSEGVGAKKEGGLWGVGRGGGKGREGGRLRETGGGGGGVHKKGGRHMAEGLDGGACSNTLNTYDPRPRRMK